MHFKDGFRCYRPTAAWHHKDQLHPFLCIRLTEVMRWKLKRETQKIWKLNVKSQTAVQFYYLRQEGYVFATVHFFCCKQRNLWLLMELSGNVLICPIRNKYLEVGGDMKTAITKKLIFVNSNWTNNDVSVNLLLKVCFNGQWIYI